MKASSPTDDVTQSVLLERASARLRTAMLQDALTLTIAALGEQGTRCALLGGLAVSAWTEPRFTRDVDLAVAVQSDSEAERMIHGLVQRGWRLLATVEQKASGRLATARLLPPGEGPEGMVVRRSKRPSGAPRAARAGVKRIG